MKIDNEAFDLLKTLAGRSKIISDSKPADTIINLYQELWIKELASILNKCTVIDKNGQIVRKPIK